MVYSSAAGPFMFFIRQCSSKALSACVTEPVECQSFSIRRFSENCITTDTGLCFNGSPNLFLSSVIFLLEPFDVSSRSISVGFAVPDYDSAPLCFLVQQ